MVRLDTAYVSGLQMMLCLVKYHCCRKLLITLCVLYAIRKDNKIVERRSSMSIEE